MNTFVMWLVRVWCLLVASGAALRMSGFGSDLPWRTLGWGMVMIALLVFIASVAWERHRRKRDGFFVYLRGGGEDGSLTYNEAGRTLELYFRRSQRMIYVPTDAAWKSIMPTWAKDRKNEIVSRIRSQLGQGRFGRSWSYDETDSMDLLMSQKVIDKGAMGP